MNSIQNIYYNNHTIHVGIYAYITINYVKVVNDVDYLKIGKYCKCRHSPIIDDNHQLGWGMMSITFRQCAEQHSKSIFYM